jgi:hypothetical protein
MIVNIQDLYTRGALLALEKQSKLYALTGDAPWKIDNDRGVIVFEKRSIFRRKSPIEFATHYIATESFKSQSWLWADANLEMGFPKASLLTVRSARQALVRQGITEATQDQIQLNDQDEMLPYHLVVAIDQVVSASVSYACDHDAGKVHLVLRDERIEQQPNFNGAQLREAISELIRVEIDISKAVISYLRAKEYNIDESVSGYLRCKLDTGEIFSMRISNSGNGKKIIEFDYV